jgi:hypothetical protein
LQNAAARRQDNKTLFREAADRYQNSQRDYHRERQWPASSPGRVNLRGLMNQ